MAAPNLANLSRPGAVAGRAPNVYGVSLLFLESLSRSCIKGTTCARDIADFEIVPLH
jgi:hypothetical protein